MTKKSFTNNPAMDFISKETIEAVDGKAEKPAKTEAPERYKLNPEYIELRSKRVQFLIQPSLYEAVKAKGNAEGIDSFSEMINRALEKYIEE